MGKGEAVYWKKRKKKNKTKKYQQTKSCPYQVAWACCAKSNKHFVLLLNMFCSLPLGMWHRHFYKSARAWCFLVMPALMLPAVVDTSIWCILIAFQSCLFIDHDSWCMFKLCERMSYNILNGQWPLVGEDLWYLC